MPLVTYRTILADPPWPERLSGQRRRAKGAVSGPLPYPTMTVAEICQLPMASLAAPDCHLWLWTTNQHLRAGFDVMEAWGFKYLAPIHWVKPSGVGNWFIHRTQTLLFGYREKCRFEAARYRPNVLHTKDPVRHSQKPMESYELIESVSMPARLELFAREQREGWDVWGDEVKSNIQLEVPACP